MSKKSRSRLQANMYEDSEELIYSTEEIVKTKHISPQGINKVRPVATSSTISKDAELKNKIFGGAISEKVVSCKCNKCNAHVNGTLINCIYSPGADIITPFVSYDCSNCGHLGFRSVLSKALPAKEFDRTYF